MTRLPTLLTAVALLGLSSCATRHVIVSAVPRSDLRIVVFTDNRTQGDDLLDWLEARGYDNPHNQVAVLEETEGTVHWGAAPLSYIEEIAAWVEGRLGLELERERAFRPDDYSVFVYLGGGPARSAEPPDREDLRVVIFTDDRARGEQLLARLHALGYASDENYVTDEPNEDPNIKWGAASDEVIEEVTALADSMFGIELDRQRTFAEDDNDLFVNLPLGAVRAGPGRADFAITVFCSDPELGRRLLDRLERAGYTNGANQVLPEPNDELNVKYGALPDAMLAEIAGLVQDEVGAEPELLPELGRTGTDVFINLPARP